MTAVPNQSPPSVPPPGLRRRLIVVGDPDTKDRTGELARSLPPEHAIIASYAFAALAPKQVELITDLDAIASALVACMSESADLWVPWPAEDLCSPMKLAQLTTVAGALGVGIRLGQPIDMMDVGRGPKDLMAMVATVLAAGAADSLIHEAIDVIARPRTAAPPAADPSYLCRVRDVVQLLARRGMSPSAIAKAMRDLGVQAFWIEKRWTRTEVQHLLPGGAYADFTA